MPAEGEGERGRRSGGRGGSEEGGRGRSGRSPRARRGAGRGVAKLLGKKEGRQAGGQQPRVGWRRGGGRRGLGGGGWGFPVGGWGRRPRAAEGLALGLLGGLEDLEGAHKSLVDGHHAAGVVELAAVVWGGEDGDELAAGEELVAVLDDLVGAADEVEVHLAEELGDDVLAEGEGDAAVVLAPAHHVLVRVGPEEVAEEARVGDVRRSDDPLDLVDLLELGREPAVAAEDFLVDDRRDREAVEAVREGLPHLDVVPTLALVVEPVDPVDARALVVPAEDEEVLGVLNFEGQQEAYRLERLLPAVDVVPEEEVVRLGREPPVLEQPQQVVVLPVNVPADLYRRLQLQQNRLRHEHLPRPHAQHPDLVVLQRHLLPRPLTAHRQQLLQHPVHRVAARHPDDERFQTSRSAEAASRADASIDLRRGLASSTPTSLRLTPTRERETRTRRHRPTDRPIDPAASASSRTPHRASTRLAPPTARETRLSAPHSPQVSLLPTGASSPADRMTRRTARPPSSLVDDNTTLCCVACPL
mmetsp:Transcript_17525/g.54741  ORF Transcript_17525/g.54741 Transcript_17525/m.54741 type:complete len:529 (-) Transcript_17525:13-1599(-)